MTAQEQMDMFLAQAVQWGQSLRWTSSDGMYEIVLSGVHLTKLELSNFNDTAAADDYLTLATY